jgi:phenylalanyl-tRNA synthetase beta chain
MKISANWLKDYIELDLSTSDLINTMESIGLMVESWKEEDDDLILDLETYANRPDTLGHLGIARELSVKLDLPLKEQSWPISEIGIETSDLIDIHILDENLCPRYTGIIVKDIRIGPSPDWLRRRIKAIGLNPINNIVDVSNYVLFSTAQPIHTFDLAKLEGGEIIVREAFKGERLISLDGTDISLTPEMLVIADKKKPVALAGIIGGEKTAVSASTTDVFIESACFDPVSIRKTAKKIGVQTDASYRFERGTDISFPPQAAMMMASLLAQFGGKITKSLVDVFPNPKKEKSVVLRYHRIKELLGLDIEEEFITRTLAMLGFSIDQQQQKIWQIKVPSFRIDIEREADIIEEIARFYGYEKIPLTLPPLKELELGMDPERARINELRRMMFHAGYDEVVNFSFNDPAKEVVLKSGKTPVPIRNPISTVASLLRTTLIGGLLENVAWNINRGADRVHIFEVGKTYFSQEDSTYEEQTLAFVITGFIGFEHWQEKRKKADFFHLKGTCEALMSQLGYKSFSFKIEEVGCFEEEQALLLHLKGEKIGYLGMIKREILDAYSIKRTIWAAELNLSNLFQKQHQTFHFSPIGRFPSVSRDVSFIVDQDVRYQDIKQAVEKLSIPFLESFYLQDRFAGSPVPKGKVSLSFRFIFRHPGKTLLAEEADLYQTQIISALKTGFHFLLREEESIDK